MPRYRHPSVPGSPADQRVTLWLPKAERDNIVRLSREAGLSVSAFLRGLARAAGQDDTQAAITDLIATLEVRLVEVQADQIEHQEREARARAEALREPAAEAMRVYQAAAQIQGETQARLDNALNNGLRWPASTSPHPQYKSQ